MLMLANESVNLKFIANLLNNVIYLSNKLKLLPTYPFYDSENLPVQNYVLSSRLTSHQNF